MAVDINTNETRQAWLIQFHEMVRDMECIITGNQICNVQTAYY